MTTAVQWISQPASGPGSARGRFEFREWMQANLDERHCTNCIKMRLVLCTGMGDCAAMCCRIESLESRRLFASVPTGFTDTVIASGITDETAMEFAPDGRLFVLQQTGQVRVIQNGTLLPTPFVTLNVDSTVERGLLGIAFDPNFATDHFVYLYHTVPAPDLHNQISRFTADGDVAVPGSETDIFDLDPLNPAAGNHNGGAIHFGPDGKLYIGTGDNANGANSQSLDTTLGKILRINPDGSIPTDNPFYATTTGNNRAIWALGVRNPFTFAFNPVTGRMFIDDVGANTWEEIDDGIAGSNYGWPITEGPTTDPQFRSPLFAYEHGVPSSEGGIAITGGSFYQPPAATFPTRFVGGYFFSDLGGGWVHLFNPKTGAESDFASGFDEPVDLKVDAEGNLFVLDHGDGTVHEISFPAAPTAPVIQLPKAGQLYTAGSELLFRGSAAKSFRPKSFSWTIDYFKNGIDTGVVKTVRGRKSGALLIPRESTTPNDFYRIALTITDSAGDTTTVTRDVRPRLTSVTISASPATATIMLDGAPTPTPDTFNAVVGSVHRVNRRQCVIHRGVNRIRVRASQRPASACFGKRCADTVAPPRIRGLSLECLRFDRLYEAD